MDKPDDKPPSALDSIANKRICEKPTESSQNPAVKPHSGKTLIQRLVRMKQLREQGYVPHPHEFHPSPSRGAQQGIDQAHQLKAQLFGSKDAPATNDALIKALVKEGLIYGVVYKGAPELRIQTDAASELLTSIGVKFGHRPEGGRVIERDSLLKAAGGAQYMLDDCLKGLKTGKRNEPMQLPDTGSKSLLY